MRVLVTRPRIAGEATALELMRLGHEPLLLPLSEPSHDVDGAIAALSSPCQSLALTSAETCRVLQSVGSGLEPWLDKPLFVVGQKTAQAAEALGFTDITIGGGDGHLLADAVLKRHLARHLTPLLYLAGAPRSPGFETALRGEGVEHETHVCYRMLEISYDAEQIGQLFLTAPDVILFYSAEAVRTFFRLPLGSSRQALRETRFLCLSHACLEAVPEEFRATSLVSTAPREQSLLALL